MKSLIFIKKEKGIVLKTISFKESSLIFRFFSEKSGGLKLIAFGIKRITNPYRGIISPGNLVEILYHKRETSEFGKMRGAKLLWKPLNVTHDYKKFMFMEYILDKVEKYIGENMNFPSLYHYTLNFLREINSISDINKSVVTSSLLKLLKTVGLGPELEHCIRCRKRIYEGYFVVSEGGIFCSNCSLENENKIKLDNKTLSLLKFLIKEKYNYCKNLKINNFDFLENLIKQFFSFYIGENFLKNFQKLIKEF
ncbi:MAG: DNA repair protein RecO [Candidatus Hydrothermales bacterium]